MQDPEAYIHGNRFPLKVTNEFLAKYFHLIQWKKEGEVVADLGCGPGNVTWDVLKKMLPENCGTIYALDIEERMLEFGRKHYPELTFLKADVGSMKFGLQLRNSVDHIFSFFCFHWIKDQRQLMKNLFDILKPGGDVLTTFVGPHPICEAYKIMLKMEKWREYKKELELGIFAYQLVENIEASLRQSLTETGFDILMCKCEDYPYVFESQQQLHDFIGGVHVLQKYPAHIKESFVIEVVEKFQATNAVTKDESRITVIYKIISYCVRKPASNSYYINSREL